MELTAGQRRVVEHRGEPLRVTGEPGSGRTTALVARYLALVAEGRRPSSVLVVCPSRAAAARFRDAVLPELSGGFDALPVTTWFGVAFEVVARVRGPVQLVSGAEQRALVRRLLAAESPDAWPDSGRYLGREAFVDEVARALLDVPRGTSAELDRFAERYAAALDERGGLDRTGLVAAAAAGADPSRYDHVLVDDHDPAGDRLLAALAGPETGVAVVSHDGLALAGPVAEVALGESFRTPAEPLLVTCPHPSMEPEAVAGELLGARGRGVAWSQMAVLVRRPRQRGRAVARALGRHGIPVVPGAGLGPAGDDPAVGAIVDLLRWAVGDESRAGRLDASPLAAVGPEALVALRDEVAAAAATSTPAALAFLVWERGLGHLVASGRPQDDATLDAVVAFLDRLERRADDDPAERLPGLLAALDAGDVRPDPWPAPGPAGGDAVTVTSIAAAAGREWDTVVLAGCVEGELPRIRDRVPLFDAAPASPAERRRAALAAERRLFRTACTRATAQVVATAAPEPGVLLSRFVEGWLRRAAQAPDLRGPAPLSRTPTRSPVAVFPGGALTLSASQLDTYDDCPLRYAYQYGLRVRDDASAPMTLGTLVHEVLAEFLRPGREGPHTREALLAIAAERWRDDIARYRPQVEECRRDYYAMLEAWWAGEGAALPPADVLDTEHRFEIEVGDVRLVGSIDRVDRSPLGGGTRIVDYKTGRHEPRPDELPDDLQLAVYHLAASRDAELSAYGPPRQLHLLFLRTMRPFEQPIAAGHAEATEARVLAAAADIRDERFEPAVDASCRTCSFHRLCPLQPEGREVGAR